MHDWLSSAFALVCGQNPDHTWMFAGAPLPFCERCTGLYVGACVAMIALRRFRPERTAAFLWTHVALLVLMGPFGFHLVPQEAVLRTVSGVWFGFGVIALLNSWGPNPSPGSARGYWIVFILTLGAVPLAADSNSSLAYGVLSWLGSLGAIFLLGSVLKLFVDFFRAVGHRAAPAR